MQKLRTPEERFQNLQDFPFAPHYVEVDDGDGGTLRLHYLDECPADKEPTSCETILCMHGQPSWSYLYRKMIPIFVTAGYRVIAPDLVGFGRSDKPAARSDYTYANHVHWMNGFIRNLDPPPLTLVCQDWGGLIGLRVLIENQDRFARVVAANTGLPDAQGIPDEMAPELRKLLADTPALPPLDMLAKLAAPADARPGFMYWIRHCDAYPEFDPSEVIGLSVKHCTDNDRAAYSAPFPSEEYLQGARQFPSLVPIIPDDPAIPANRAAWEALAKFNKPFLTAFSDSDPVTAGFEVRFQKEIPGAQQQKHVTIKGAGHFLQEDAGKELAEAVIHFIKNNPS